MLTLCKGISRDRAAASENESWSGFVPNFIVYTNPKSTLRFRRRRCDVKKKKKKKRKLETSVLLVRLQGAFAMCVCVCVLVLEGEGTRTYLRLGSPPGRSSSVSRCVVEGRRKTRVRGLVVLGSVTCFFFFSPFFGDSHQELGDGGHGRLVRFSLSLSLVGDLRARFEGMPVAFAFGLEFAPLRVCPFHPVKGGRICVPRDFYSIFHDKKSQNRSKFVKSSC